MTKPSSLPADRIELMQTFVRIVEAGSLSAAAVQLGMTQPTVSRRLQALERLLGLRLLLRSTHSLVLTGDGERCYAHAKELAQTWHAMEEDLRSARDAPMGTLRVQVPHAFGQDQLLPPLLAYLTRYPDVAVEWLLQDQRIDLMSAGLDCAIHVGPVHETNVVALLLAEVPRIVVAAPSLLDGRQPARDVNALPGLPWVTLNPYYRDEIQLTHVRDGHSQRLAILPRMSTDSLYALRAAVLAGVGAGVASHWIVADDLRHGRLVRLAPDWQAPPLPVSLVYPYARFQPARLRAFIDIMRTAMPALTGMTPPSAAPHHAPRDPA